MANETLNAAITGEPAQTTNLNNANGNGANTNPETVSKADYDALQSKVNSFAATIRRLQEGKETPVAVVPPKDSKAEDVITQRLKALEDRDGKVTARARSTAIRDAASAAGVDAIRIPFVQSYLLQEYGNRIKVLDDESVVYTGEFDGDTATPINDFIKSFVNKTEFLKPAVATPASKNMRNSGNGAVRNVAYADMPEAERQKLSPEQALAMVRAEMGQG